MAGTRDAITPPPAIASPDAPPAPEAAEAAAAVTAEASRSTPRDGVPAHQQPQPQPRAANAAQPVRRWVMVVLGLCIALFVYHLFADRLTPFTSQAAISGFVIPIAPEVAGLITAVEVTDNQPVDAGQVLVRIDDTRYRLAVAEAEANLGQAGQEVGAGTAGVETALAQLEDARAHLAHMRRQSVRVQNLVAQQAMAAARLDQAVAAVAQAEAAVAAAVANVAKAEEERGPRGTDNPRVQAALSALRLARRQVEDTVIRAPSAGVITDLQIATGNYAAVGRPLMTFIASDDVWIRAAMRENNLGELGAGDAAEVVLDVDPGRVHRGRVVSIGWGVAEGPGGSTPGELPTYRPQTSWLRQARRFPVRIELDDTLPAGTRVGSQASVIVYTGEHPLLNALGWLRIRLESLLTYVY